MARVATRPRPTTSSSQGLVRWATQAARRGTGFRSLDFVIPLKPVPCPRPRTTRSGRTYYPKSYETWRYGDGIPEGQAGALDYVGFHRLDPPLEGPLLAFVESVLPLPVTVTRDYPQYDVDNYAKSILDVVTKAGGIWKDDEQVAALVSCKRYVERGESPHSFVYIRELA